MLLKGAITLALSELAWTHSSRSFTHFNVSGEITFRLNNILYLANTHHPRIVYSGNWTSDQLSWTPMTVISVNTTRVTKEDLEETILSYLSTDDVFNLSFLETVLIRDAVEGVLDDPAVQYLQWLNVSTIIASPKFTVPPSSMEVVNVTTDPRNKMVEGPFLGIARRDEIHLCPVYRLYSDEYGVFVNGVYDSGDGNGTHRALGLNDVESFGQSLIPVPSRIYTRRDPRPLAGVRVGVKDLFDLKGVQTTAGSKAWTRITPIANATAPAIQRIIDLGGHIVGKQKLAQFAAAANPWEWQDVHYPFNPRGDGWLTCSASSSGGGCSIAAYDWLDFAIGTDTGSSMRLPAAVAGVYGQRPSQGLISLDRAVPISHATDTAGVFSRDPKKWAHFAKTWYTSALQQPPSLTGLPAYTVPDTTHLPTHLIHLSDLSPDNPAVQPIWASFTTNLTKLFNLTTQTTNFTTLLETAPQRTKSLLLNQTSPISRALWTYEQWHLVAKPLLTTWPNHSTLPFPPLDPIMRTKWQAQLLAPIPESDFKEALSARRQAVAWFEENVLPSSSDSCSGSLLIYDIGPGGLPSYREWWLNMLPGTTFLYGGGGGGEGVLGASICPVFGCVDLTLPIGEVEYRSAVGLGVEMVPVTVSVVGGRGCDFVLFNLVERLAEEGVLRTVQTGRRAFG
ncbi:amidase family protein [Aspergillus avenaceus]|uniref:Amidase family protein n=1 Tax=Aspergillus avenaceus TaxID=36643 RepID=A0A5N6U0R2_ASPAV|nr:amidase family protein [Aspergillus avenaceus]